MNTKQEKSSTKSKCELCGSTKKTLIKTECCDNWICDDAHTYKAFSYERNSCWRNHDRFTLCGPHFHEGHKGHWQDCKECKKDIDLPNYVYYGTNEFNFEVLKNPEKVTIKCANCGFTANSVGEFALQTSKGYFCTKDECQEAGFKF